VRAALDALVQRGLAGALGISNCPLEKLQTTLGHQHAEGRKRFTWLQNNQNFAVREAPEAFRRYCAGQGINVVTFSPLGAGFLTGKHDAGVVPGSRFSVAPAHQDIYFNAPSRRRLEVLFTTAREFGLPQASLALAWALRRPNTRLVLIGGREPAQIDQAFAARDESLAKAVAKLETVSPDDPAI
jgi:aryl-alcohol dehydrogenase-like predicted oxidoreductase